MYRWGDYLRLNETIALCGTGCVVFDIQAPSHRCNSIYPYFRSEISDAYEAVVENLSQDIQKEFPGIQGFSARNMWDMARFYSEYQSNKILQPLVAEISWTKHIVILTKCKETQQRQFYICATRCVIFDIQAQCLVKAPQKDKFYLSFGIPSGGL